MPAQVSGMAALWALPLAKKGLPLAKKGFGNAAKKYAKQYAKKYAKEYTKPVLSEAVELGESVFIGGKDSEPSEPLSPPADIKAEQELFEEDLAARAWLQETWPQREMRDKVEGDKTRWEEEMAARNARFDRGARKKLMEAQLKKLWVNQKKDKLKKEHPEWWTALKQKEALENQTKQQARVSQRSQPGQHGGRRPEARARRREEEASGGVHPRRTAHDLADKRQRSTPHPNSHAIYSTSLPIRHRGPAQAQATQSPHVKLEAAPSPSAEPTENDYDDDSDWSSYVSSSRPVSPHPRNSHQRATSAPPPRVNVWHSNWPKLDGNDHMNPQGRHLNALDRAQPSKASNQLSAEGQNMRRSPLSSEGYDRASSTSRRKDRVTQQFNVDAYMEEEERRMHDPMQRSSRLLPN